MNTRDEDIKIGVIFTNDYFKVEMDLNISEKWENIGPKNLFRNVETGQIFIVRYASVTRVRGYHRDKPVILLHLQNTQARREILERYNNVTGFME